MVAGAGALAVLGLGLVRLENGHDFPHEDSDLKLADFGLAVYVRQGDLRF